MGVKRNKKKRRIQDKKKRRIQDRLVREEDRLGSTWSDLPHDLLELILQKIIGDINDIRSFKAVCPSWRTFAKSSSLHLASSRTPWFLFGIENQVSGLFDPKTNKVHRLENFFNDFRDFRCVGSSHGWIVMFYIPVDSRKSMFDFQTQRQSRKSMAHVFNPITRASIPIPGNTTLYGPRNKITNGIISSNPSRNKDFYVVVTWLNGLALCKHGDQSWTWFDDEQREQSYDDIMFHNDRLLALPSGNAKSLEVWDCKGSKPIKTMHIQNSTALLQGKTYLVESLMGDILRVGKIWNRNHYTVKKLNLTEEKWEEVASLDHEVLYVHGGHQSMPFSSPCFVGCEGNSICFTHYSRRGRCHIYMYKFRNSRVSGTQLLWNLLDMPGKEQKDCLKWQKCVWVHPNPW